MRSEKFLKMSAPGALEAIGRLADFTLSEVLWEGVTQNYDTFQPLT